MNLKNNIIFFILLITISYNYAQKSSLEDIIDFENTIEDKEYLKLILDLPYDVAVRNPRKYNKLTNKAIQLAEKLLDTSLLADSYLKKALALHYSTKIDLAIDYTLKAIKLYEFTGKVDKIGKAYSDLGWRLKERNINKSLNYMLIGISTLEKTKNYNLLSGSYDNYGVLQGYVKHWDSAKYYHQKSLILKKKLNDSIGMPFSFSHLANVYLKNKKYDLALKYLDSAYTIRLKRNDIYGITDSYLYYGDLYFEKKDFENAINNYLKGYQLSKTNNYSPLKKYATEYLFKSYQNIGDYENALHHNLIFSNLKDSILNSSTNTKIAELEIEYQTEKKEKEIAQQREKILQSEVKIKNRNLFNVLLGSGILILALVSYGTFKYQVNKRRQLRKQLALKDKLANTETQNKLQQQRLRISRDLHDNIGSQLTFITSSIDNLKYSSKPENPVLKNKLEEIDVFTKNTISQLRDTVWAMNKNEITIDDFYGRILSFVEKAKKVKPDINFNTNNNTTTKLVFSSVVGINLYRIIQEAINNAIKYANASKITTTLNEENETIIFSVTDDGEGFDQKDVVLGSGLENMQKRADEVNALLHINSALHKGTEIIIKINRNTINIV